MCYVNTFCQYCAKRCPNTFVKIVHPLSTIFVMAAIVFFFSVQMFYIAPQVYKDMAYKLYWILAIFIMQNILGNWLACYRTSSSVQTLPKDCQKPVPEEEHLWRYCEPCKKLMPPRSWHCGLCKCCILRRDHHCIFTATCIGHNNQRYFFWFTFYLTFGLIVSFATFCNHLARNGCNMLMMPDLFSNLLLELLCKNHDSTSNSSLFQTITYSLNIFAFLIPGFMLTYQVQILCLNSSYYRIFDDVYDLGFLKNCELIMGQRGLWTFLSPLLKSPLPHDGTQWQMKQQ